MFSKLLSSVLGIGYLGKGGGTVAAVACCCWLYQTRGRGRNLRPGPATRTTVALLAVGTLAAQRVEADWGKDSSRVVLDEVAGMWLSMLCVPATPANLAAGLLLFRFFDVRKPLGIRALERLPGGLGVMADDVLAGVYANAVLRLGRQAAGLR